MPFFDYGRFDVPVLPYLFEQKVVYFPFSNVNVQHSTQESCRSAGLAEVSTPKLIVSYISLFNYSTKSYYIIA